MLGKRRKAVSSVHVCNKFYQLSVINITFQYCNLFSNGPSNERQTSILSKPAGVACPSMGVTPSVFSESIGSIKGVWE